VLDRKGNLEHEGGVLTGAPGLYVLGLPFLRRRKSTLIDGVGEDARELSAHLAAYVGAKRAQSSVAVAASS
jgi:putative flavoprotein involved in K+ transport